MPLIATSMRHPPADAEERQPLARDSTEDDTFYDLDSITDDGSPKAIASDQKVIESPFGSKIGLAVGLALMAITFGIDAATTSSYSSYALSSFKKLSQQGLLDVLDSTVTASLKLPVAKFSDVLGRAETYCVLMLLYAAGHLTRATAPSFGFFVLGFLLYGAGQAGTAILNLVLISDLTTPRLRGLAANTFYLSILITPWASGLIVDSVVDGIGWRWGYGMFALIMPLGGSVLTATLFHLQQRTRAASVITESKTTFRDVCSQADVGGLALLCGGLAMFLLPMMLASQSEDGSTSLWPLFVMSLGAVLVLSAWPYEKYIARRPAVPVRYFRNMTIVFALLLCCFDAIAYRATHTYLFPWSIAARNFTPGHALYLSYANGITSCIVGVITGAFMYRWRSYKWITVLGSVIRLLGYGVMIRLRNNDSSIVELFIVQIIQGIGSGIIETTVFIAVQIVTPANELAQVTALAAMSLHIGGGIGSAIAGRIYTANMKPRLRLRLGIDVDEDQIRNLYDSITGTLPEWGSDQRTAVGAAYSDVLGYITVVAVVVSLPPVLFALLLPDKKLEY